LARALAWLGAKVIIAEIAETGAEVETLIRSEGGTALFVSAAGHNLQSSFALTARLVIPPPVPR
jgi:hypothetical protein